MPGSSGHPVTRLARAMRSIPARAGVVGVAWVAGAWVASATDRSEPTVRLESASVIAGATSGDVRAWRQPPSARAAGGPSSAVSGQAETEAPVCEGPPPGPSWVCHADGAWHLGPAPGTSSGAGAPPDWRGCPTGRPGPSFVCRNGMWLIEIAAPVTTAGSPDPGASPPSVVAPPPTDTQPGAAPPLPGMPDAPTPGAPPALSCPEPRPVAPAGMAVRCVNGLWIAGPPGAALR